MTERGVGNGASIIITAGIVATMPADIFSVFRLVGLGEMNLLEAVLVLAFLFVASEVGICAGGIGERAEQV